MIIFPIFNETPKIIISNKKYHQPYIIGIKKNRQIQIIPVIIYINLPSCDLVKSDE